jgi:deoxyribose-phosphate aldolase
MKITRQQLASMIDHSLLKPNATLEELKKVCQEAVQYKFKAVCINPIFVADAVSLLKGKDVLVCSVVGFPFGTHSSEIKAKETTEVIERGAREVDMVIWVGALKEKKDRDVVKDIRAVVDAARGCPVKVILETCYLTEEEKVRGCRLVMEAGAAFVKTSTGFASGGATFGDVKLIKNTVGKDFGVKAAGGIRTLEEALKMIEAGANRVGTSSSVAIIKELKD